VLLLLLYDLEFMWLPGLTIGLKSFVSTNIRDDLLATLFDSLPSVG